MPSSLIFLKKLSAIHYLLILCVSLFISSALWLLFSGQSYIHLSADSETRTHFINYVIPSVAGISLAILFRSSTRTRVILNAASRKIIRKQAHVLIALAFGFAASMLAVYFYGLDIQSWFAVFKLLFMIIAPAILFYHYRKSRINIQSQRLWMIPSIIVVVWVSIFFTITPVQVLAYTNIDITSLLVGLLASFLLNAVLEELLTASGSKHG